MILSEQRHHSDLKIPMYSKFSKCDICWATNTKAQELSRLLLIKVGITICKMIKMILSNVFSKSYGGPMRASAPARGGTDISLEEARGMREESEAAVHHRNRRDGSEKN